LVALFGVAGFAREVDWLLHDLHASGGPDLRPTRFVAEDGNPLVGGSLKGRPVISDSEFLRLDPSVAVTAFVAVGSSSTRRRIVESLTGRSMVFPAVMHPSASMDRREDAVRLGAGTIVCAGAVITTGIEIGRFVHIDMACTVGHDCVIEDFARVSPGACVSGNVRLGAGVFIGAGAVVREHVEICSHAVIGAGAVVLESIREPGTYVGVPARRL
jgi:sugar O-acyltransferase (sialic acid O-acetyltransferase NeuD family)